MFYKTIIFLAFGLSISKAFPLNSSVPVAQPFPRPSQNNNNESTNDINGFDGKQSPLQNIDTLDTTRQDPQYQRKETNIVNNNNPEIAVLQTTLYVIDQSELKYDGSNIGSGKNVSMKLKIELMKQIQTYIEAMIL